MAFFSFGVSRGDERWVGAVRPTVAVGRPRRSPGGRPPLNGGIIGRTKGIEGLVGYRGHDGETQTTTMQTSDIEPRRFERIMIGTVVAAVVCATAVAAFASDAGVPPGPDAAPGPDHKVKPGAAVKTMTFYYEDASGTQALVVSFLPKHRLALKITRDRKDGCHWSKDLTARFDGVQAYGLHDGDNTDVNEYKIEPKQMSCDMFLDIEKETMAFADITTKRCASACALSGHPVMRPK